MVALAKRVPTPGIEAPDESHEFLATLRIRRRLARFHDRQIFKPAVEIGQEYGISIVGQTLSHLMHERMMPNPSMKKITAGHGPEVPSGVKT